MIQMAIFQFGNKMNQNHRFDDSPFMKIVKLWPLLVVLFTAGAWYENAETQKSIVQNVVAKQAVDSERITRVEDAVISLQKIADWTDRHRR